MSDELPGSHRRVSFALAVFHRLDADPDPARAQLLTCTPAQHRRLANHREPEPASQESLLRTPTTGSLISHGFEVNPIAQQKGSVDLPQFTLAWQNVGDHSVAGFNPRIDAALNVTLEPIGHNLHPIPSTIIWRSEDLQESPIAGLTHQKAAQCLTCLEPVGISGNEHTGAAVNDGESWIRKVIHPRSAFGVGREHTLTDQS